LTRKGYFDLAKEKAPHMPWYGREFYSDENVLVMTLEQEAAYLRLLWNCWQEGSIPADTTKLASICKNIPPRTFERRVWPAVRDLFSAGIDGRLIHRKVESLREAKEARRAKCSDAGKRGNELRWGSDRVPDESATETGSGLDCKTISADCRLPNTDYRLSNTDNEKTNICAPDGARVCDSDSACLSEEKPADPLVAQQDEWFTKWWAAYWLKRDRRKALGAFREHVRTAARFAEVMRATLAQADDMLAKEPEHRPYGATWLNGERWEDE
jgi:uncharacterized protein YdaU (DUF1376 family)